MPSQNWRAARTKAKGLTQPVWPPALAGSERLEAPIVEDEQPHLAVPLHEPAIAAVASGEREIGEQLGDALIEDGAVVATGLVAEGAGEPRFADPGGTFDDEIVRGVDPIAGDQPLEQGSIEITRRAPVDILDGGALTELGMTQPGGELAVGALGGLAVEQQGEPLGVAEAGGALVALQLGEGAGHAGEAELDELIDGGMCEQDLSPQW